MIILKINLTVLAEKQKELLQTLLSLIESIKKEKGCSSYALFYEITDKNSFCIMEEWTNQKDLNHHLRSFRFGVLLGTKPLLLKPPIIQIYTPIDIRGMVFVEAIRAKEKE